MVNHLEIRSSYYYNEGNAIVSNTPHNNLIDSPHFKVIDQNAPEFKTKFIASTHLSKILVNGLGDELKSICESYSGKKLASRIHKALGETNGLSLNDCAKELEGYDFNTSNPYKTGVNAEFFIKSGSDKRTVIFHIPSFVPTNDLRIPKKATNFKIMARLVSSSDLYDKEGGLGLMKPKQDGKVGSFETPMLPILKMSTQPMTSQLRLLDVGAIRDNVSTVLVVGVKFYEYADRKFSLLKESGMMSIVKIF